MKITLSVIKADVGSIGGHIAPSRRLLDTVKCEVAQRACDLDAYERAGEYRHRGDARAVTASLPAA